jgi:hypothetical protein
LTVQLAARHGADPLVANHLDGLGLEGEFVGQLAGPLEAIERAEPFGIAGT